MTTWLVAPDTIHCVLITSNHKCAKNGRNQSRSDRRRVLFFSFGKTSSTSPYPKATAKLYEKHPKSKQVHLTAVQL